MERHLMLAHFALGKERAEEERRAKAARLA